MQKLLIWFCVIAGLVPAGGKAGQYDYHPKTTLELGGSFDPLHPLATFRNCLVFTPRRIENTTVSATFDAKLVKTRSELLQIMNVSAGLSGHYGLFGGSAGFTYDQEYSFESDSLTWALIATNDYGRVKTSADESLETFAQKLIDSHKWTEFSNTCGKEVATQERRIAKVAAVFSISNLSESQKKNLQAAASFEGGSSGVWSAAASASYHQFVSQASQLSTIKVSVLVVGGDGISYLSGLATDYSDLQKVTAAVKDYISRLSFDKAAPLSYATANWSAFGWQGNPLDFARQYAIMGDLYIKYQDAQRAITRIHDILQTAELPEYQDRLSAADKKKLNDADVAFRNVVDDLLDRADKCRSDQNNCKSTSGILLPTPVWPSLLAISRTVVLQVSHQGCNPPPGKVGYPCQTQLLVDVTYDENVVDKMSFEYHVVPRLSSFEPKQVDPPDFLKIAPDVPIVPGRWKSTQLQTVMAGYLKDVLLVVRDKHGIDEVHTIQLE